MQKRMSLLIVAVTLLAMLISPSFVQAATPQSGLNRNDFSMISKDGFGDPQNNYAWGMTYFKGDLYVGTGRNVLYFIGLQLKAYGVLPADFTISAITHPGGSPPPPYCDPNNLPSHPEVVQWSKDMSPQIWRYHAGTWKLVHVAQTFVNPQNFYTYPEGVGYRFMTTFTDKYGQEAIYAGVGIGFGNTVVIKSTDGLVWEKVNFTHVAPPYDTRAMAVHNGKLYIGLGIGAGFSPGAIYASDDPNSVTDTWTEVGDFGTGVAIGALKSFNGYLYASTWGGTSGGFEVWRSNAQAPNNPALGDWTQVISSGAGDSWNPWGSDLESFKGNLYAGSMGWPLDVNTETFHAPKGFDLMRINTADSWDLIVGNYEVPTERTGGITRGTPLSGWPSGFGNPLNLYAWQMEEYSGTLYLGTFDASSLLRFVTPDLLQSLLPLNQDTINMLISELQKYGIPDEYVAALIQILQNANPDDIATLSQQLGNYLGGADMWKTCDGVKWIPVDLNGFGDPNNYGFRTMVSTRCGLFVGTSNPFEGCQVWVGYSPPSVFSEGFESGSFSKWTGKSVSYGEAATVISIQGKHIAKFTSNGGGGNEWAYCYKSISSAGNVRATGDFKVLSSGIIDDGDNMNLMALRSGSNIVAYAGWSQTSGVIHWSLMIRDGAGWTTTYSASSPSLNQWCNVQLRWVKGATSGYGELWVNGKLACSLYGKNTAAYGSVNRVHFGLAQLVNCANAKTYADNCRICAGPKSLP